MENIDDENEMKQKLFKMDGAKGDATNNNVNVYIDANVTKAQLQPLQRFTTRRRQNAVVRWTQLLSWACKYHTQASTLRPNWAACLSNSGISLYRLAVMGKLDALLSDTSTSIVGGVSPLVAPTPRAAAQSSSGSATSTDDGSQNEDDEKDDSEDAEEIIEENASEEARQARQIVQADVNSRIRQLLTLALKSVKRAHAISVSNHLSTTEIESYSAAIEFLQAELFLRSYVFMMKAHPCKLVKDGNSSDDDDDDVDDATNIMDPIHSLLSNHTSDNKSKKEKQKK